MSALHRSRRQPAAPKDPLLRPPAPSRNKRSTSPQKSDTSRGVRSPSIPNQLVNGSTTHAETLNSTVVAQNSAAEDSASAALSPASAAQQATKSDNSSSGLSEPDETADESFEPQSLQDLRKSQREADSEAETERLEDTPQRKQKHTTPTSQSRLVESSSAVEGGATELIDDADVALAANVEDALADDEADDEEQKIQRAARGFSEPSSKIETKELPAELTGRKRKRTTSIAAPLAEGEPAPKRTSTRQESKTSGSRSRSISAKEIAALGGPPVQVEEEHSSNDEEANLEREAASDDEHPTPVILAAPDEEDQAMVEEDDAQDDLKEAMKEPDDGAEVEGIGADEPVEEEGEEEEGEAGTKNEDEIAKKNVAMQALMPIENLFAIFRDKLFDERLAMVSAELEMLNQPNPTHPDYLEMRKAIDLRRDEKIQLEQVLLYYKIGCLENKAIADRAQLHSQLYQAARELREDHLSRLNEDFTRIQRERRKWKAKEPHYSYLFKPDRFEQVAEQRSYNKEVSLLSGIARHVGFPAAPRLEGARAAEVDDDFKAMKLQNRPVSYATQIANTARADEVAAKEQFLESTPWANPNHPVHKQASAVEPQQSSVHHPRPPTHTPAGHRWLVDLQHQPSAGSAGSTIPASDPPSSMFGTSGGPTAIPPESGGPTDAARHFSAQNDSMGSSPLDHYKRRVSHVQQEDPAPLHASVLSAPQITPERPPAAPIPAPFDTSSAPQPPSHSSPAAEPPSSPPRTADPGAPGPQQDESSKQPAAQSPTLPKTEPAPAADGPPALGENVSAESGPTAVGTGTEAS